MDNRLYNGQFLKLMAKNANPQNIKLIKRLRDKKPDNFDDIMANLHYNAFKKVDCLLCANCCKSLGPLITNNDITLLSKHLGLKQKVFIDSYLRIDEDNDYVFKTMPCPFLEPDNKCSIYEYRPKACREYPHTNHKKMLKLLNLALKNIETCPAVYLIFDNLKQQYK